MPLVLEELLDEAPVTWARSYGGPLLPPMMLREPITDFPLDIPVQRAEPEMTMCSLNGCDIYSDLIINV